MILSSGIRGLSWLVFWKKGGKLLVNGRVLDNDRKYRVATTEFLAMGSLRLLPKQQEAVRNTPIIDILIKHFREQGGVNRSLLYKRLEKRRIYSHTVALDVAYERLNFGGSADQYQYVDPSTFGIGSDIPGLVGTPHDSLRIDLGAEAVLEDPGSASTIRLDATYSTWNESRSVDRAAFTFRREATSIDSRPRLFGEYKLTGTIRAPQLPDESHPVFGKAVAGMIWKLSERSRLLAGLGHLSRFSQPGNPMSLGLNIQYELRRNLHKNVEFKMAFDGFASWEDERIKTGNLDLEFRFRITRYMSTVAKYKRFLWSDSDVDDSATRNEVFLGFGITRSLRLF